MPVMDEFKEEREALKHGTLKEKLSYFFEYYKWHVIAIAAGAFFIISIGWHWLTQKDTAIYAALINAVEMPRAEEYAQSFAEAAGIDTDEYEVHLDASMRIDLNVLDQVTITSSEKLTAYIAAKNVDVFVTDEAIMQHYAYSDTFLDLREFLSEEQYAQYQPYFYYLDQTVMEEYLANRNGMDTSNVIEYPDPRNPEAMDDPIPVGIYLKADSALKDSFYYTGDCIAAIVGNTKRAENVSKFIDFIFE